MSNKELIQSEALLEYVGSVIATYVTDPSIYKYAYNNSKVFRNFIENSSEGMKKYYTALRNNNRAKSIRKGLLGVAAMGTIFAPVAVVSGISKAVKTNKIKNSVHTKWFEDFFAFLTETPFESIALENAVLKNAYDKAVKLNEQNS